MRTPKSPIELNPVLIRYIFDIEDEQSLRDDPSVQTDRTSGFFIKTLEDTEYYPENHEELFDKFKKYFLKEKILEFPDLDEFLKKHNWTWENERRYTTTTYRHPYRSVFFETDFLVKIINPKKFKAFCKKYKPKTVITHETKSKKWDITHYDETTKTLEKSGLKSHDFRTQRYTKPFSLEVFETLWKKRRHIITDSQKLSRQGEPIPFLPFVRGLELIHDSLALDRNKELEPRLKRRIVDVIKNLQQKKHYPFKLECKKNRVLLTVKD